MITKGYVLEGNMVQFKINIELPDELKGATTSVVLPEEVTKTEDVYSVTKNGTYEFEVKANKDGADYKTTVITTTDQILDNFEPASIAPHRFELKVELNEHLTDEEQRELSLLRDKVKKLDDKSNRSRDEFYEYDPPEDNNDKDWWEDPVEVYWRMG